MSDDDFMIAMYEADIYHDMLDYMYYKKDSELLINLNATKICAFFSQYLTFKMPNDDQYIENDLNEEYS